MVDTIANSARSRRNQAGTWADAKRERERNAKGRNPGAEKHKGRIRRAQPPGRGARAEHAAGAGREKRERDATDQGPGASGASIGLRAPEGQEA